MLGYTVNVTCYSALLSERDFESFLPIFKGMEVQKKVTYSTLSGLIERLVKPGGFLPDLGQATEVFLKNSQFDSWARTASKSTQPEGGGLWQGEAGMCAHLAQRRHEQVEGVEHRRGDDQLIERRIEAHEPSDERDVANVRRHDKRDLAASDEREDV